MKKKFFILIIGGALFFQNNVYACSPLVPDDPDYVTPPTSEERFNVAADVVVARIVSSSITKEFYEQNPYSSGYEELTLEIEKVYKGDREPGENINIERFYGSPAECLDEPLFRYLPQYNDEEWGFYQGLKNPAVVVYLGSNFDGRAGATLLGATELVDMVSTHDEIFKGVSGTVSGLPAKTDNLTRIEMQAEIDRLLALVSELQAQLAARQSLEFKEFSIGSTVRTTDRLRVRSAGGTNAELIGVKDISATGVVIKGPHEVGGYTWWYVNFDDNDVDGWVASDWLRKY